MMRGAFRTSTLPHFHTFALVCVALALAPQPALALDSSIMLADGQTLEDVAIRPADAGDGVVIEKEGKPVQTIKPQDLLVIDFGKIAGRPVTPTLRLANGDQVFGRLSFPSARQVKVSAGWGSLQAPLAWCSALRLDEKAALPEPVTKDTVVLANDRVEGEVQGIAGGKVNLDISGKQVPVEMSRVQAIALAPRAHAADDKPGLLLNLDLGGGEKLTGQWVKLTRDVLTVRMAWGDTVDVPVASLSRLEVKNGKLVYLSDLKPSENRQTPYLEGTFPLLSDRAVSGRPIRLSGKTYARGLGMHSKSEVTYALNGGFQTFQALTGVDDAVGSQGSVLFRVYGDEKLLYEGPVLRGGDVPVEVKLDVKKVVLLRLEADYADGGDVADHADWADARLLRQ